MTDFTSLFAAPTIGTSSFQPSVNTVPYNPNNDFTVPSTAPNTTINSEVGPKVDQTTMSKTVTITEVDKDNRPTKINMIDPYSTFTISMSNGEPIDMLPTTTNIPATTPTTTINIPATTPTTTINIPATTPTTTINIPDNINEKFIDMLSEPATNTEQKQNIEDSTFIMNDNDESSDPFHMSSAPLPDILPKEKLSILCIGDPHYKESNIIDMEEFNVKLLNFVKEKKPDIIVLLGDILHDHKDINVYPLELATKLITTLADLLPVIILIGNHDRPNNSDFMSKYHPFPGLDGKHNITLVASTKEQYIKGHRLIFVPYVYPGRFDEALGYLSHPYYNVTSYFAHQEFRGAKMGAIESKVGDIWPEERSLVIAGHIHDYDKLQSNVIYTGTPLMHGYGDTHHKTVSWFDFDETGKWEETRHDLQITPKITISITADQFYSWVPPNTKYVRLNIKGTSAEIASITKSQRFAELKMMGIKLNPKTTDETDITPVISMIANENNPNFGNVQQRFFGESKFYIEKFRDLLANNTELTDLFDRKLGEYMKSYSIFNIATVSNNSNGNSNNSNGNGNNDLFSMKTNNNSEFVINDSTGYQQGNSGFASSNDSTGYQQGNSGFASSNNFTGYQQGNSGFASSNNSTGYQQGNSGFASSNNSTGYQPNNSNNSGFASSNNSTGYQPNNSGFSSSNNSGYQQGNSGFASNNNSITYQPNNATTYRPFSSIPVTPGYTPSSGYTPSPNYRK